MSTLFAKQFGLESDVEPLIGEGEAPVDAVIDTLEETSEIEEIETGEGGLEELEEGIETVADAAEQLEEVVEYLEKKEEEGGMTEGEAEAVELATESILRPFRGYLTVKVPATESFSATGGRANATSIAIEGFKETIDKMWKAVKDFVMGIVKRIQDWFEANVSAGGRLKKAAAAIAAKADAAKDTADKVELAPAVLRLLSTSSGFAGAALKGELAKVAQAVSNNVAIKELEAPAKDYTEGMTKVDLTSVEKATGSIDGGLSSIDAKAIFGKFGKEVSGDKRFEGENVSTFANEAFPVGGKSQFLSVVMGDKPWYMKRVKLQMLDTDPSKEVKEAKTVSGLNKDEVKAVAKSAEAIGDAIINAGKAYKKSKEDIDKMFAAGDKLSKEIGKAPEDVQALEAVKNLKTVLNAYSTLGSVLATCQSQLVNEAKQIGFAALTFCSKSLKGGKAAEASKEGAAA